MPSSCPICHSGHRAPLGPRPNPPLRFRCGAPASEDGRRSGRVKRWQERGGKQEEKNGEPFSFFQPPPTVTTSRKKNLFAPHRQHEAAALFLSRNLCSILRAFSVPPSSHPPTPQTQPHISAPGSAPPSQDHLGGYSSHPDS